MKIHLLIIAALLIFSSCSNSSKSLKTGDSGTTNQQCLSAINEDSYEEMTRISVKKDESALKEMVNNNEVYILQGGTVGTIRDVKFGKYYFECNVYGETKRLWVSSKFID